ncbi:NAD(P)-dependent oxidoreductase [Variovorax rhizosphaerae]|uniref:NAD(P)-dependent oxidoreductase n=1 Tax=Variovorax rhizosphaerae TaxID=1836200 RepID=A0ABU8WTC6_9BURK
MNIGYIGLGSMGGALARHLVGKYPLTVWDLNSASCAAFKELGATVAPTAAELARQCDIILLCLPRTSDVHKLMFSPGGLAEGLSAGKLVVDQTSGVPGETVAIAKVLAERGIEMIDAPVSGGVVGAAAGTITIMASGPQAQYDRALPVLSTISSNVFRCGERVGDGQAMKLVNNLLSAGCRLATLEIVAMGKKQGLSLATMVNVINKASGRNRTTKVTLQGMVDGNPAVANFAMALMLKDVSQSADLGMACGVPTTMANIVRGLLQIGVNTLGKDAQFDRVMELMESMAETSIADAPGSQPVQPSATTSDADAKALRVGYVGLGAMGGALVRRLLLSRPVSVYDVSAETAGTFAADGAETVSDLSSLARSCDVIFICVPTSTVVREVLFGKGGLAEGLSAGKIVVDQTTGDPSITRAIEADLAKLGVPLIDAPVSGGPAGATAGTVAIMCGGQADAFAKVRPVFEQISPNIVHCGASGNGHATKLVHNALAACNQLLVYEAASIAVKYGLRLSDVATLINKSTGFSGASERILPALSERKATVNFQLQLMVKDLKLVAKMASDCGAPVLFSSTACALFEMGSKKFGGTTNMDAMAQLYESFADFTFVGA